MIAGEAAIREQSRPPQKSEDAMRKFIIAALLAVGLCGAASVASAEPCVVAAPVVVAPVVAPGYITVVRYVNGHRIEERREIRQERREIRQDRHEIRHDVHDLRGRR
jgi:hypothetical protein